MRRARGALKIISLCVAGAVLYGIVHDQVTARICVEYFTIGHVRVLGGATDPTLLGLWWGVIATWWAGAGLGIPLALVCVVGRRPPMPARLLVRPLAIVLGCMSVIATVAGLIGWRLAVHGKMRLIGWVARHVPEDRHIAFLVDLWAHNASYVSGLVGGAALTVWAWRWRRRAGRAIAGPVESAAGGDRAG